MFHKLFYLRQRYRKKSLTSCNWRRSTCSFILRHPSTVYLYSKIRANGASRAKLKPPFNFFKNVYNCQIYVRRLVAPASGNNVAKQLSVTRERRSPKSPIAAWPDEAKAVVTEKRHPCALYRPSDHCAFGWRMIPIQWLTKQFPTWVDN